MKNLVLIPGGGGGGGEQKSTLTLSNHTFLRPATCTVYSGHPNLTTPTNHSHCPYPVTQNGTLQDLIEHMQHAGQPLNETKILELFLSLCKGLQAMHMCSTGAIAHRDIKVSGVRG